MAQVNVHYAKTHLSKLLERVERGEEIVIARAGKPVARLVAAPPPVLRKGGFMKGHGWIADDFDAPMTPEELAEWYDSPIFPDEKPGEGKPPPAPKPDPGKR